MAEQSSAAPLLLLFHVDKKCLNCARDLLWATYQIECKCNSFSVTFFGQALAFFQMLLSVCWSVINFTSIENSNLLSLSNSYLVKFGRMFPSFHRSRSTICKRWAKLVNCSLLGCVERLSILNNLVRNVEIGAVHAKSAQSQPISKMLQN